MQSANSPPPKPKRYYVAVTQQLAENSQTVRGVIKQNKKLGNKNDSENTNQPKNRNAPNGTPNPNISHASSSSSVNNDSFYDDDDNLSDNRLYPSCYNRQKIVVAPLGKTSEHDPNQQSPTSKGYHSNRPK